MHVQLQMKIFQVEYAVWKEEDLFVQRVPMEKEFIEDAMERAYHL